jgi:hypothetical protein
MMLAAAARIETPNAPKYLARLCGRLARSAPARLYDDEGFVDLPLGPCHLSALPGSLALVVEAEDEVALRDLQWMVGNHLQRVAAPEPLALVWAPVW